MLRHKICALAFGACALALPAHAEDCGPLKLAAAIQMKQIYDGYGNLVPVKIEGTPRMLLLDTGGYMSQLTTAVADELKLESRKSMVQLYDIAGNISERFVISKDFEIGGMHASGLPFMVISPNSNFGKGDQAFDGILAGDFMLKYDVELDFAAAKLNYFLTDHCEGRVIYWPHDAVGVVPVSVFDNQIRATVELDGKSIRAVIDTGATNSTMSMPLAKRLFGLTPESPGVTQGGIVNGDPTLRSYRYKFSKLSFGDISVANLNMSLLPDVVNRYGDNSQQTEFRSKRNNDDIHLSDMLIGMDVLRHLHIYMAFREHRFYVTPAAAASPAPAPATAAPAQ